LLGDPWPIRLIAVAKPDDFGHVPALREAGGFGDRPAPGLVVHVDDEFRIDS
jgi:hypothetical protein